MDFTILWGFIRKSELSLVFSHIDLIFGKRINFVGNTREIKASIIVVNFLTTEGFLKLHLNLWLVLEHRQGPKNSTHQFWKCVSCFSKHVSYTIYLDVIGTDVAEVFAKPFQYVYKTSSPVGYRSAVLSSDFLQLP